MAGGKEHERRILPGNGFDTYETQDKVLVSMDGSVDCGVAVRILQQQGFGVAGAVVQLTAADKLGIQYIATGHHARVELGSDGVHTVCPAVDAVLDESAALAALPQDTLARLLLPLGEFTAADVQEMAQDFKVNGTV